MYKEDLLSEEWNEKRKSILERDNYSCVKCKSNNVILHVHHKLYIKGRKPWEYANKHLTTLCDTCHSWLHGSEYVPSVDKKQSKGYYKDAKRKSRIDVSKMEDMLNHRDSVINSRYKSLGIVNQTKPLENMYTPKKPKFIGPKKKKRKTNMKK